MPTPIPPNYIPNPFNGLIQTYDEATDTFIAQGVVVQQKKCMLSADVEFFLKRTGTDDFQPVTGMIGATKNNPIWITKNTGILEDNVALEINMPPASRASDFKYTCLNAMADLTGWASAHGCYLFDFPEVTIKSELLTQYPQLGEFGCSKDYIAYGQNPTRARESVKALDLGNKRFAAGHLHLSYDVDKIPPHVMARWLDAAVGLSSIYWDKQGERRKYYGLAGLYRPTQYPNGDKGVEYRTLSNSWFFDKSKVQRISEAIFTLVRYLQENTDLAKKEYAEVPWQDVKDAINNESKTDARKLNSYFRKNGGVLGTCMDHMYPFDLGAREVMPAHDEDMES